MGSKTANEADGVFVGTNALKLMSRQGQINYGECPAPPSQGEMRAAIGAVYGNDYFFQQGVQEFLPIAVGSGRRVPHLA
jgi:hypothetical protein